MTDKELLQGNKYILDQIKKFARQQIEFKKQELAKIVENYDFIVGSIKCKIELMKILPDKANIVYSPYITSPNIIYVIKKFDVLDLLSEIK